MTNRESRSLGEYRLIDAVNNIAASGIATDGRAEICDWGFGVHSLKVIKPGYYATVITPVYFIYGRSQILKVVLNPYIEHELTVTRCSCYFRVKDTGGRQLSDVKVSFGEQTIYSDEYGRVQVVSPGYKDMIVRFEKAGYEPAVEKMNCTKAVQKNTSSYVVLKPTP